MSEPLSEAQKIVNASKAIDLSQSDAIHKASDEIDWIYFPIDAVASAVAVLEDGSSVEISMTGREGIVGMPALIGGGRALHWTRVSVSGAALRISTLSMQKLFNDNEAIHGDIMSSYRSLFTQICQRSVCNVRHTLLQRLCVWLLMMNDRVGGYELPLTQGRAASHCRPTCSIHV